MLHNIGTYTHIRAHIDTLANSRALIVIQLLRHILKVLERSIKLLFDTKDISKVKSYVMRQCGRVLNGRVSIGEYTFAREYRGKSSYRPGACVPALELTRYDAVC